MKPRHLLFGLLAIGAIAAAGDQAPPPGESRPPQEAPGSSKPAPTPKPAAKPTPDPAKQLEEFVPSEEVPAEQSVAFPVDI